MSSASSENNDPDSFEYKVVVYLTTGKIMIQGSKYSYWRSEEFHETLEIVDELSQSENSPIMSPVRDTDATNIPNLDDSVTFKKQVYSPPDESQPSKNSESTIIDPGEPTITEPLRTEPTVAEPLKPTSESLHSHKKPELVDEVEITELCSEIQTLNSRFSKLESSLTNISAVVLSINSVVLALQQTMKNEIIIAVKATVSESLPKGNTNTQTENQ